MSSNHPALGDPESNFIMQRGISAAEWRRKMEESAAYREEQLSKLTMDNFFHHLWTKTVGTDGYDKAAWKSVQAQLAKAGLLSSTPVTLLLARMSEHPNPDLPQVVKPLAGVLQDWVTGIPRMQQTVLLTAIRGPDGVQKYGPVKMLLRWYRRCILISAIDARVIDNPVDTNGGSFTGPSVTCVQFEPWRPKMNQLVDEYLRLLDGLPHHFHMHFTHGVEILGYKHPSNQIREFWHTVYLRFVKDAHMQPETREALDERLGDSRSGWLKHADKATVE